MALLTLFAFLAGGATAISPCVLPVLPALLAASSAGGRRRPLGIVIGLAVTFTVVIVGLAKVVDGVGLGDGFTRYLAIVILAAAGLVLLVSSILAAWIAGMRAGAAAALLTAGWTLSLATLGSVFAAWQQVSVWASATEPPPAGTSKLVALAPWLLLASLALVAASLLIAR